MFFFKFLLKWYNLCLLPKSRKWTTISPYFVTFIEQRANTYNIHATSSCKSLCGISHLNSTFAFIDLRS